MNIATAWQLRQTTLTFERLPAVMGVVNVTPDSFSDGGRFFDAGRAVGHALQLVQDGAEILDVGGESTRPDSEKVDSEEELRRVIPVVAGIVSQTETPVSIDTSKASVARAALDAGAQIINDVTGLEGDPSMIDVALETGAGVCAMHMQGTPQTMQDNPHYENVVQEIKEYLLQRKNSLLDAGIPLEKICLDPGIGFGKTHEHNLELIGNSRQFLDLGCPILVGHSRKGFIGKILGDKTVDRDAGTLAISLNLARQNVQLIRVHEVAKTVQALRVLGAIAWPNKAN
jgi:dihydropteroate synthase